jgi:Pyrimidine dimer DNA glycosylase
MRLWSLHPSLLDAKGLVALRREALLAQRVLQGKTTGYRNHPQLQRFRQSEKPLAAIATYLWAVQDEATARGYAFDASKIDDKRQRMTISVGREQLAFEWGHLKEKLRKRDPKHYQAVRRMKIVPHPLFTVVAGGIEVWERGPRSRTSLLGRSAERGRRSRIRT